VITGRLVALVLAVSIGLWAAMVYGTLARLTELAGGNPPFDMLPFGYGFDEARSLLALLGREGRDYYARTQLALDSVYPASYALSRGLLLWWLTMPGRLGEQPVPMTARILIIVAPLAAAGFDYYENSRIAAMLAIGPTVEPDLVASASRATVAKSLASLVTEIVVILLATVAFLRRWRRRYLRARQQIDLRIQGGAVMSERKIDIYNHVMPRAVADRIRELAPDKGDMVKRVTSIPMLYDIEARVRMMEQWPGYQQVLTLSSPPIETIAGPSDTPDLARVANDELLKICMMRPDKFTAWVASLPLNNVDASLEEMDRAIASGARGIQIFTNVNGRPLDDAEFLPIFSHATNHHKVPIWMHPARDARVADYPGETKSKYEIWQVLGWPYETSVAMARIVFSGMLDRLPEMKIITHHLGAMIPYFEGRVGPLWDQLGTRTSDEDYSGILAAMTAKNRRPIDYFRLFYNDTAVGGARSAIRCGLDFFGADHVLFATDCPFDPEGGPMFIRDTIAALDALGLAGDERAAIYSGNALRMLKMQAV
jgi:uncharacterized protein